MRGDVGDMGESWLRERPGRRALRALQSKLGRITEALACELGQPGSTTARWSDPEWVLARAVAAIHGVSGLLAATGRWQGPPAWHAWLAEQRRITEIRHAQLRALLGEIDAAAGRDGIGLIALKGAALHAAGLYRPGERPMADLDLLVRGPELQHAAQLLRGMGLSETGRTWKHRTFEAPGTGEPAALGEGKDHGHKIELHDRVQESLAGQLLDITEWILPEPLSAGIHFYPSRTELLRHLLLHAAGAMIFRGLRLVQLHDIALLARSLHPTEWQTLLAPAAGRLAETRAGTTERLAAPETPWWAYPPLALTQRYYRCVPEWVLAQLAARCPWLLRTRAQRQQLSEASLSHLWVDAFPGIEWSRTPGGMLAYAAQRVMPSAETRRLRSEFAVRQPLVSGGSWSQLSQSRRVLRWLTSRPARHETLQPVRAALREQA